MSVRPEFFFRLLIASNKFFFGHLKRNEIELYVIHVNIKNHFKNSELDKPKKKNQLLEYLINILKG